MVDRKRVALEALGADHLTIRELWERMKTELPDCQFYATDVRPLVMRLLGDEKVGRDGERWRNKTRYRYFVSAGSKARIVDLERRFHETNGEEGA